MEASTLGRHNGIALPRSRRLLSALRDERLLDQLRRGNEVAFEVIYDRHYPGILSFCRHMLGSREEGEDAVQQTFLSAYGELVGGERPLKLKAWLYAIARNRCLSVLRARREQPAGAVVLETVGLAEEVERRTDLRELLADLAELPESQRAALVLAELGDLSHAEVAQVLGCEVAKVKSLVFQARSALVENRRAREIPCEEIRRQLATLHGGALRRGPLRRHLKHCPGCSEFREEVRRQRQMMAVVLPVIPSLGLKGGVLAALGAGGGAGAAAGGLGAAAGAGAAVSGAAAGGPLAALATKVGVGKLVAVVLLAGGGAVGGGVAITDGDRPPARNGAAEPASSQGPGGAPGAAVPAAGGSAEDGEVEQADSDSGERGERSRGKGRRGKQGRRRGRGFTPVQGESNGERARELAKTRGRGKKRGLHKQRKARRSRPVKRPRPVRPPRKSRPDPLEPVPAEPAPEADLEEELTGAGTRRPETLRRPRRAASVR